MKTSEVLQLQALKYKKEVLETHPGLMQEEGQPDWMYEGLGNDESRNICALIPLVLFDEIERVSGILSISKRRIVEIALRDFALNANKALDEVGFDATSISYEAWGSIPKDVE